MRRITAEEVVAAYRATGLKAETCTMEPGQRESCCAFGALITQRQGAPSRFMAYRELASMFGLTEQYVSGFIAGFDCGSKGLDLKRTDDYTLGRQDGTAVRQEMFAKGLWRNESVERSYDN